LLPVTEEEMFQGRENDISHRMYVLMLLLLLADDVPDGRKAGRDPGPPPALHAGLDWRPCILRMGLFSFLEAELTLGVVELGIFRR
jgi:hypothetical protein